MLVMVMEMERVLIQKKDKRKKFEVANPKDLNQYVCKFPRLSRNNENVSKKFIQNELETNAMIEIIKLLFIKKKK